MEKLTSRELMALAFEHSGTATVLIQKRRILECNNAFCELFEYSRSELIGELMLKLYPSFADFQSIGDRSYKKMLKSPNYADERFMQTQRDRKSTRLNCCYVGNSYGVCCLK